jgi:hypothetical protein
MEAKSVLVKKSGGRRYLPVLAFLYALSLATHTSAQGRFVAEEGVDIIIQSAAALFLRVGSPGGTIDLVSFDVTGIPGSGQVTGIPSGANPVLVRARAQGLSGQMVLTADSSVPLNNGSGNTIPFTEIGWTGHSGMPSGTFSGASNQFILATSSANFQGAMFFYYGNTLYVPSGTYTGRVTYSLSSP